MNCNEFELKITDLARGRVIEAGARERAIAHTAECRRCAARLRDEQQLTAGLRELAATYESEQMPAHGEARLLAALRAERTPAPVAKPARHWLRWAAAAAFIVALIALAAARFIESRRPQPLADNPTQQQQLSPTPERNATPSTPNDASPLPARAAVPSRRTPHGPPSAPRKPARKPAADATLAAKPSPAATGDESSEIATSFIALDGGNGLAGPESLQMVRVELPRSALVSFGLPMNVERADERIKADVLVGNDGVPRAIRFVR